MPHSGVHIVRYRAAEEGYGGHIQEGGKGIVCSVVPPHLLHAAARPCPIFTALRVSAEGDACRSSIPVVISHAYAVVVHAVMVRQVQQGAVIWEVADVPTAASTSTVVEHML